MKRINARNSLIDNCCYHQNVIGKRPFCLIPGSFVHLKHNVVDKTQGGWILPLVLSDYIKLDASVARATPNEQVLCVTFAYV